MHIQPRSAGEQASHKQETAGVKAAAQPKAGVSRKITVGFRVEVRGFRV